MLPFHTLNLPDETYPQLPNATISRDTLETFGITVSDVKARLSNIPAFNTDRDPSVLIIE